MKKICLICFLLLVFLQPVCSQLTASKQNGALVIRIDQQPVLSYQYETVYPPPGVDSAYRRSGFIHPLRTLSDHVLTRIQPEDHYHHYGIWNPWTHVLFEGDTLDFWNLAKKEGTVRFAGFERIDSTGFQVRHEHVVLKNGTEKTALHEVQAVSVLSLNDRYYAVDFTIDYQCAADSPFRILEYRYGGFGWRATEAWNDNNSEVLTSAGKTRADADGSLARWCIVQGELGEDYGGMVLMSHPDNYNHPEPLRIWPANADNGGAVFVNVSPTKNRDWLLEPGKTYTLRYRLIVFNDRFFADRAEQLWQDYAKR